MFGFGYLYSLLTKALDAKIVTRERTNPFSRPWMPPESGRYWHDPSKPEHLALLNAAEDKRRRKAKKLDTWAFLSADNNRAHVDEFDNLHERLNPFYVAK